jgi:uncharacterized protein YdaU (DUF1376 family)
LARKQRPYVAFFYKDFYEDTADMEVWQVGAYIRLLCKQGVLFNEYSKALDAGTHAEDFSGLPADDKKLMKWAGLSPYQWKIFKQIFTKYFANNTENFYKNFKMQTELLKAYGYSQKQRQRKVGDVGTGFVIGVQKVHRGTHHGSHRGGNNISSTTVFNTNVEDNTRMDATAVHPVSVTVSLQCLDIVAKLREQTEKKFNKNFDNILTDWQLYYTQRFADWASRSPWQLGKSLTTFCENLFATWEKEREIKGGGNAVGLKAPFKIN